VLKTVNWKIVVERVLFPEGVVNEPAEEGRKCSLFKITFVWDLENQIIISSTSSWSKSCITLIHLFVHYTTDDFLNVNLC
jgi:hypothetical protein